MSEPHPKADALREAVVGGRPGEVVTQLQGLTEEERAAIRRALSKEMHERAKEWRDSLRAPFRTTSTANPKEWQRLWAEWQKGQGSWTASLNAARLLFAGTGTRREAGAALAGERRGFFGDDYRRPVEEWFHYRVGLVLAGRDVDWRNEGLLALLAVEDDPSGAATAMPRLALGMHLVRSGILPSDDALPSLSRLARQTGFHQFDWSDPLHLDIVWAAFEARDEPPMAGQGQRLFEPIRAAVADGRIERERLFELALRRMAEISRPFGVNWWASLLERLKPTPADWLARRDAALDLVAAPTARAASVGLGAARQLLAKGELTAEELLPPLSSAVGSETVGVAKGAVTLLRAIAKREESYRPEALALALGALTHPKPAVQEAALAWLEGETWWRRDEGIAPQVADMAAYVAPAAGARLRRILDTMALAEDGGQHPQIGLPITPGRRDRTGQTDRTGAGLTAAPSLRDTVAERLAVEKEPAQRVLLQACLDALDGKGPLPEPPPPADGLWRQDAPFTVPQSPEETAELLLNPHQVAHDGPTMERVFAGVRLPVRDPESLRRILDPVWQDPVVGPLARAWAAPQAPDTEPEKGWGALSFWARPPADYQRRAAAAIRALRRGCREMPLCTPTHASGWLDPEVLVERVAARKRIEEDELFALSSALYRLPLDHAARVTAWERFAPMAARLGGRVRRALEAALDPKRQGSRLGHAVGVLIGLPSIEWLRLAMAAGQWDGAADLPAPLGAALRFVRVLPQFLFPERALGILQSAGFVPGQIAFEAPYLAQPLILAILRAPEDPSSRGYAFMQEPALRLARRRDVALRPLLVRMVQVTAQGDAPVQEAFTDLLAAGLNDGRLRTGDVVEHLGRALATRELKPRVMLSALSHLAGESAAFAEMAACCAERAVALGLGAVTPTERVAILDALLAWRTGAGRGVEGPDALAALTKLAAERKSNRTVDLARQLVQLSPTPAARPPSRTLCLEHDVAALLQALDLPVGDAVEAVV